MSLLQFSWGFFFLCFWCLFICLLFFINLLHILFVILISHVLLPHVETSGHVENGSPQICEWYGSLVVLSYLNWVRNGAFIIKFFLNSFPQSSVSITEHKLQSKWCSSFTKGYLPANTCQQLNISKMKNTHIKGLFRHLFLSFILSASMLRL